MSKDQTEAEFERENDLEQPRRSGLAGLRAQPGFRTAVIAFVLTVVLGVGGTAAYAYWSKSVPVSITGSTRSDLPANTTVIGAQPALLARPGKPSDQTCVPQLNHGQMQGKELADIDFGWNAAPRASSYVITVKATKSSYVFADLVTKSDTKTVTTSAATFRFPRLPSNPPGGAPIYTEYAIRVMPFNGSVPGDPHYFTFLYEHNTNTCWSGIRPEVPAFAPVGTAGTVQCAPLTGTGAGGYSDIGVNWAKSERATSYSVRILNPAGYGAETTVTDTSATFRVARASSERDDEPYFGQYQVRVQPMNGNLAGDPIYKTYQFGKWSQECW